MVSVEHPATSRRPLPMAGELVGLRGCRRIKISASDLWLKGSGLGPVFIIFKGPAVGWFRGLGLKTFRCKQAFGRLHGSSMKA